MLYLNSQVIPVMLPTQWKDEHGCQATYDKYGQSFTCGLSTDHDYDHVAVDSGRYIVACWSDAWNDGEDVTDHSDTYYFVFNGFRIPLLSPNREPFYSYADMGCEIQIPGSDYQCNRHDNSSHNAIKGGMIKAMATEEFINDAQSFLNVMLQS